MPADIHGSILTGPNTYTNLGVDVIWESTDDERKTERKRERKNERMKEQTPMGAIQSTNNHAASDNIEPVLLLDDSTETCLYLLRKILSRFVVISRLTIGYLRKKLQEKNIM